MERFLRTYRPRFQRQKTIGSYIVDFYCHEAKLAVEPDGAQHDEKQAMDYDAVKTEFLNAAVDKDFSGVCMMSD